MSNEALLRKLEASRKDLLDLGLRNPLINFRPRKNGLEIVDELGAEVLRILVAESRAMSFAPLPERAAERLARREGAGNAPDAGDDVGDRPADRGSANAEPPREDRTNADTSTVIRATLDTADTTPDTAPDWAEIFAEDEEDPGRDGPAARHTDNKLQTKLVADELTLRLIKIASLARTHIEEQGVNVLYLAVGMLDWYEAESSQTPRRAPLLLIPVELERSSARERFRIRHNGEDVGDNLSLRAKLRNDFAIDLPEYGGEETQDIGDYMSAVAAAVANQPRWKVAADDIYLGFFSFGKFLMYNDLDPATWPEVACVTDNPLVSALLGDGFREEPSSIAEDAHLDDLLPPDKLHTILDADSSQTVAIVDAIEGRNLVIQGPPGTGKSQTITNLVAEALGQGKRVLFVAEKMAALEVVKRRLDAVGVGDAALELHSHKTNKKALLEELNRTLNLGKPVARGAEDDVATLTRLRDQLNAYAKAANEPVGATDVTPIAALGHILELTQAGAAVPRLDYAEMAGWTSADFRDRRVVVGELARKLDQMGRPVDSPFWGSRMRYFDPLAQHKLAGAIQEAARANAALEETAAALAEQLGLKKPEDTSQAAVLCRAARRAMNAPHDVFAVHLTTGEWQARRDDIAALVEAGAGLAAARSKFDEQLIPEAWDQDLLEVRQHYLQYGSKWWRVLSGNFRLARARLRGLCRQELPRDTDACMAIIDAVMDARRHNEVVERHSALGASLFRSQWQGAASDWEVLGKISQWVVELYREIGDGELPAGIVDFLAANPSVGALEDAVAAVEAAQSAWYAATAEADRLLELDPEQQLSPAAVSSAPETTFAVHAERIGAWSGNLDALQWMTEFNRLSDSLCEAGLAKAAERATTWERTSADLERAFELTWYEGLYSVAAAERKALRDFDRTAHEHALETFQRLDAMLLAHVRNRLVLRHWEQVPKLGQSGELGILSREINKKTRHLPIRRLMAEAGRAVQAIKPLFMMSPMSIATYIPPGAVEFDLVIFDEASQVKPVEAFGALLRGHQAIVVGDSKQLPPTSFFAMMGEAEEEDEDNVTADQESILGLFNAQNAPSRMLEWHYRSRHESLIAVSNHEFYDNRLMVFPSPGQDAAAAGLSFEYLPATAYDRGRTRTNRDEARAVAETVLRHAREFPDLTLGVVAFSTAQRDAIEIELEALRRQNPDGEDFFNANPDEPFFIKNLENVQGDERDVILISIGYGKTAEGYFAQSFGPLNLDGGERRLNVLISRARLACRVFANFTADDLDLNRTKARGVAALKTFLSYAATRVLDVPKHTGRAPDSVFEEQVLGQLAGRGLEIVPQVGVAGFFIDLAVRDPEQPGRYVLGVECDGASYHSARSARDRDRLREAVLRGLGWEIHRIWSTDWFRNPERETLRVLEAVEKARLAHKRRAARVGGAGGRDVGEAEQGSDGAAKGNGNGGAADDGSAGAIAVGQVDPGSVDASPSDRNDSGSGSGSGSQGIGGVPRRSTETRQSADADHDDVAVYRKAELTINLRSRELYDVSPSEIAEWVNQVVAIESPIHRDEVARRITSAAGYSRAGSRLVQAVMHGIGVAVQKGAARATGDFLWRPDMQDVPARNRAGLDATGKRIEFICEEEIAAALRGVVERGFSMSCEEAVASALADLGHQRPRAETKERVAAVLDRLVDGGVIVRSGDAVVHRSENRR